MKSQKISSELVSSAKRNTAYRRVVYTGPESQVVMMSLRPSEDIGVETHKHVEQAFLVVAGTGKLVMGGRKLDMHPGAVFVVRPGTRHNVKNTGKTSMKLITMYSPPNHLPGTVHMTKTDAKRDVEDEKFGESVGERGVYR